MRSQLRVIVKRILGKYGYPPDKQEKATQTVREQAATAGSGLAFNTALSAMTVGTYGRSASIYNLLSQCERFGLTADAAGKEIENIVTTVRTWREHFRACDVSEKDVDYMAQAFLPERFFFEKPPEG